MPYEAISTFDVFKIGVGPSSSHTLGPWRAAQRFVDELKQQQLLFRVKEIRVLLYGSLAKTGKGHGTDVAVQLGLLGADPEIIPVETIPQLLQDILTMRKMVLGGIHEIDFDPREDIEFLITESLPFHSNALSFLATFFDHDSVATTFYSIGGGFVIKEGEQVGAKAGIEVPFPINNAQDLQQWCIKTGLSINEIMLENESAWRS
ncbi:MAG: serine dehydratase beta chain, partial [Chitinophagaceae bacterium]